MHDLFGNLHNMQNQLKQLQSFQKSIGGPNYMQNMFPFNMMNSGEFKEMMALVNQLEQSSNQGSNQASAQPSGTSQTTTSPTSQNPNNTPNNTPPNIPPNQVFANLDQMMRIAEQMRPVIKQIGPFMQTFNKMFYR